MNFIGEKTNIAGTLVSVTVAATKTLTRYFKGEISGVECLETLGEQGTGIANAFLISTNDSLNISIESTRYFLIILSISALYSRINLMCSSQTFSIKILY